MLALTGTPVSVLVSDVAAKSAGGAFGFFEFGIVGVPLLAGTIAIVVFLGERLLPHRKGKSIPADLSQHARTLVEQDPARPGRAGGGGGGESGGPVHSRLWTGGGRDPAALAPDRQAGVPRHGDRERRSRDPGRAAAGRGPGARRAYPGRRRQPAPPGDMEGARRAPRRPGRPRRRLARGGAPTGGSHGGGCLHRDRRAAGDGRGARDRSGGLRHRRPCRRVRHGAAAGGDD